MRFRSYDSIKNSECETEIRGADANAIEDFSLWDTYVDHKIIREKTGILTTAFSNGTKYCACRSI